MTAAADMHHRENGQGAGEGTRELAPRLEADEADEGGGHGENPVYGQMHMKCRVEVNARLGVVV